jgi:hypothetical protein
MRRMVCVGLLLCAIGSQAQSPASLRPESQSPESQSPESQVLSVYRQLERAVRSGDADHTFVELWTRAKAPEAEKMRAQMSPQPDAHYTSQRVFVQGNEAALLGQYSQDGFLSLRFVREDGRWKIRDFAFSDTAYPPDSVYAMIPPPPGAFARAGEPWAKVALALNAASAARQGWQLRAVSDESFLYLRIESSAPVPTPGTSAEKPPMGWPVMKVDVAGGGEFVLHATANIGDQATFDASGRAKTHRHYVAYWLMLERADKPVFQNWAGTDSDSPLIQAGGKALEVRVPVRTMGITDGAHARITIGDAAWPKSAIFTAQAQPYR